MCGFADDDRRRGWLGWQFNSGVMHMQSSKLSSIGRRTVFGAALVAAALASVPQPGSAQYFGRNKVQFDDFDFQVLRTDHFDIHYYPEEQEAVEDAARMSERWYERFARAFQHEFEQTKPIVLYADHPDFEQTNTLSGFIGEGTGGVTESLKNRVIMPLAGALCFSLFQLSTRRLAKTESTDGMLYHTGVGGLVWSTLLVPFFWSETQPIHWLVFLGTGVLGAVAHLCMIQAFERAQASLLAPFNYSKLLWGVILGYLVFDELPTANTLGGTTLIIAAGLYVVYRESSDDNKAPTHTDGIR